MTFSIHMANIVFHDKPVESDGEAEEIRNDPTSSPHSRGTLTQSRGLQSKERIIPAFAGNTSPPVLFGFGRRDHPRIRGEHLNNAKKAKNDEGSSPHSRGTREERRAKAIELRIIPASAGNT